MLLIFRWKMEVPIPHPSHLKTFKQRKSSFQTCTKTPTNRAQMIAVSSVTHKGHQIHPTKVQSPINRPHHQSTRSVPSPPVTSTSLSMRWAKQLARRRKNALTSQDRRGARHASLTGVSSPRDPCKYKLSESRRKAECILKRPPRPQGSDIKCAASRGQFLSRIYTHCMYRT